MTRDYLLKCRDCWWYRESATMPKGEGQCFAYGFFVKGKEAICCEFARGK